MRTRRADVDSVPDRRRLALDLEDRLRGNVTRPAHLLRLLQGGQVTGAVGPALPSAVRHAAEYEDDRLVGAEQVLAQSLHHGLAAGSRLPNASAPTARTKREASSSAITSRGIDFAAAGPMAPHNHRGRAAQDRVRQSPFHCGDGARRFPSATAPRLPPQLAQVLPPRRIRPVGLSWEDPWWRRQYWPLILASPLSPGRRLILSRLVAVDNRFWSPTGQCETSMNLSPG